MSKILALRDVASQIDNGEGLEDTLQHLIDAACRHAGWTMGSIMVIDTQKGFGQVMVRHDPTLIAAKLPDRWDLTSSPALVALKRNEPVHIRDASTAEEYPGYLKDARNRDYRTVLVMPMNCHDDAGRPMVLSVISRQVKEVSEEQLALLGTIIHLGSIAVGRAQRQSAQTGATERLARVLAAQTQMLEHVLGDGSALSLSEMIAAVLPDPILLVDFSDGQIIAGRSPDAALFTDPEWQAMVPLHFARAILRAARRGAGSGPLVLTYGGRNVELPARIEPIAFDGQVRGALIAFPARSRSAETDPLLLESARLALGVQMMRNSLRFRSQTHALTELFRDLVEARWTGEADVHQRAHHVGLNLRLPHQMVVLDASEGVAMPGGALQEVKRFVARASPGEAASTMVVELEDRIACLLPVDSEFRRNRTHALADLLAVETSHSFEHPPIVVYGGICISPQDYAAVWQRCGRLIGIGRTFGLSGVLTANGSGPLEILVSALDADELRDYVGSSIGAVLRHDRDHGTGYLPTLAAYLREGCRSQPCADAMGLHVSTLRYRLSRIRELFGIDIDTPEKRFNLELAIRLQMITRSE